MQKVALLMESIVMLVLLGIAVWHRYQHTLKRWWKNWRARPKRPWSLRPRTAHFGVWVDEEGKRKPVRQALPTLLYGQFRKVKMGRKLN